MDIQSIKQLYSYSKEEQASFGYIRAYMALIAPEVDEICADTHMRRRFMLSGLFLTYRACNHQGQDMTTDLTRTHLSGIHEERLKQFKQVTCQDICSTSHYLKLLGIGRFQLLLPTIGKRLYRFVRGRK